MRACRPETYGSGNTQSLSGRRPIVPPIALKTLRLPAPRSSACSPMTSSVRIMRVGQVATSFLPVLVSVLTGRKDRSIGQRSARIMRSSTHFSLEVMCMRTRAMKPWLACPLALLMTLLSHGAVAAGPLVTEGFINAPVSEVWRLFTTSEGYKATGVAQASVDLRIGGEIRSRYGGPDGKGQLGDAETIVNEILAYEPERMLAMRIKQAPASFPHRSAIDGTWTVIYFNPAGENVTQVRLVGLGYQDTSESQALRQFFEQGNRETLDRIARRYWPKCPRCLLEPAPPTE